MTWIMAIGLAGLLVSVCRALDRWVTEEIDARRKTEEGT